MFTNYKLSQLEQWTVDLYHSIDITEPHQLTISELSNRLNIWVHYHKIKSCALNRAKMRSIIIDSRISPKYQWLDFLHELFHLLKHTGNQTTMTDYTINHRNVRQNNLYFTRLFHFL